MLKSRAQPGFCADRFFYFPTRKALVSAVLEEVARFFTEMAETVHGKRGPAPELILEHMRAFAEAVKHIPTIRAYCSNGAPRP